MRPGQDAGAESLSDITLVGCGHMGGALLRIWLQTFPQSRFNVIDPAPLPPEFKTLKNVMHGASPQALSTQIENTGLIVVAVKPQILEEVSKALAPCLNARTPILSIAAGQKLSKFEKWFGGGRPVIRAMPNLPAAIGKGITVAIANKNVTAAQKEMAGRLLQSAGLLEWIDEEDLLDAVTAISASGAAYVFYFIEALARAALEAGLDENLARKLARQTVIGSAALADQNPGRDASVLRQNVTSPGGTTAAALEILMAGEMQEILIKAVKAAKKRGQELNG